MLSTFSLPSSGNDPSILVIVAILIFLAALYSWIEGLFKKWKNKRKKPEDAEIKDKDTK
jgi:hypothetical protein